MSTRAEIDAMVVIDLQDDAGKLTQTERFSIIQNEAVQFFSKHRPLLKVADFSANGTYSYTINTTNFPSWSDGFSWIHKVEYPAGESQNPEDDVIPFEEWEIYEDSTTKYLRFTMDTPGSGTIRVRYYVPHSVGATSEATIKTNDIGAFVWLCTALCSMAISNRYAQSSDSTIGADAVAYRDKSAQWESRAKSWYQKYQYYMFPDKEHIIGAMSMREFDTSYAEIGLPRLTHKEWTR